MTARSRQNAPRLPQAQPQLMVPATQLRAEIDERLAAGQEIIDRPDKASEAALKEQRADYRTWNEYNEALLRRSFDLPGPADEYVRTGPMIAFGGMPSLSERFDDLHDEIRSQMRRLKSQQDRLGLYREHPDVTQPAPPPADRAALGTDVFLVHGHDTEAKVTVARFLAKLLGFEPIILHEQPDRGKTIIEKFEDHAATAACAVVLMTGDDVGGPEGGDQKPRARQNVVFEMGFFIGKLGRARVVILHEEGVEVLSDIDGVLYTKLDEAGAWQAKVARELKAAGLDLNLAALL